MCEVLRGILFIVWAENDIIKADFMPSKSTTIPAKMKIGIHLEELKIMHRNRHLFVRGFSDQKNVCLKMQICSEQIGKNAILMHLHAIIPGISSSGELENILTTNFKWFSSSVELWEVAAKFLVSSVKDIDTVGFLSFFSCFTRTIKIPLKFPAFTFNDCQSQLLIQKLIRPLLLWWGVGGGGEDHLNFAMPQGGSQKFYSYSRGSLKMYKT